MFQYQNPFTTPKLPSLEIPNLISFGLSECAQIIILRADFTKNSHLREILFFRTAIDSLEVGSFTNVPELKRLSVEHCLAEA